MEQLAHEDSGRSRPTPAPEGSPVVLFAHAFPLDRRMWRRQIETLRASGARVIAPDLRGFGASRDLPPAATIDEHADDLAALLDGLHIQRVLLCGLSMGGYIALAFARRHADRLSGLLLADTRAGADSAEAKEGREANIVRARREGSAAVFDAMIPKVFAKSRYEHGDAERHAHVEELRGIAAAQSPAGVVAALAMMRDRPDATPTLATISVPTRVVVGAEDAATPPSEAQIMARAIPGAQLTIIDGAGHFSNIERTDAFDRVLLDLFEEVTRAPTKSD